jgi:hypothetical protein
VPDVRHFLLRGGSRSAKTFLHLRTIATRAIAAPESRHAVFRFRMSHVKASVIADTWPKMMRLCHPNVGYELDKKDFFAELPNRSQVWFAGLDDKERTEKVLGQEYATILFNEVSQIPWASRNIAMTRLAQKCTYRSDGRRAAAAPARAVRLQPAAEDALGLQGVHPEGRPGHEAAARRPAALRRAADEPGAQHGEPVARVHRGAEAAAGAHAGALPRRGVQRRLGRRALDAGADREVARHEVPDLQRIVVGWTRAAPATRTTRATTRSASSSGAWGWTATPTCSKT